MDLGRRLAAWDGKDVAALAEVYDLLTTDAVLHAVCDPALGGTPQEQTAATWLQKRHLEQGARWDEERTAAWVRALDGLVPWEARLHALQCLPYLELPARSRRPLERFVRAALDDEAKFVRAWALAGMHALARRFEALRPEVEALLEASLSSGPASQRARARRLVKRGF